MEYTPLAASHITKEERPSNEIDSLTGPALVRELRIDDFSFEGDWLKLHVNACEAPLVIQRSHRMTFGTETVTTVEYLRRVLERGDLIDVIAHSAHNGAIPIDLFWIHIRYVGIPRDAGTFSRKEDGLFAMRTKAGEKAERIVAKALLNYGHSFDDGALKTPGYFEIRYDGMKRHRRPDLKCLRCGVTFEVKKRNKDERFRVSHSETRPFDSENNQLGWHAFVFPDMKPRFLSNMVISDAIAKGNFHPGLDQYDAWADVHGNEIMEMQPPRCTKT